MPKDLPDKKNKDASASNTTMKDIYGKHQLMNGSDKLRLVSVCDKETGVCLFQRTWQWRGEQERSGIGNLVQSFYQFAREVDEGEISCVNFLLPSRTHRRVSSHSTRRSRGSSTRSPQDTMQMLCTRNDHVIVAVFFDVKTCVTTTTEHQTYVRDFLHQVKDSFCDSFQRRVVSLRPTLRECADGNSNDGVLQSLQDEFAPFKETVERLRHNTFGAV